MTSSRRNSFEVRVPASTANLGAGFDCLGLALDLHLTVRATVLSEPDAQTQVRIQGVSGSSRIPLMPEKNLIFRAMRHTAERKRMRLPAVHLVVQNEIPVGAGLGSSAAAIVAGIALGFAVCGKRILENAALSYGAEIEHHADNIGAAYLGGFVLTLVRTDGSVVAIRIGWPKDIRAVVVTPVQPLETARSRAVLPKTVDRADAVHNLQRATLLVAALQERRYDLVWDAMQDRLHQPYRQSLIPGLGDILTMPRMPGLLGIALSGAGPSVVALATEKFDEIGKAIAERFRRNKLKAEIRLLAVADDGFKIKGKGLRSSHRAAE
jgi:homoserine kinase